MPQSFGTLYSAESLAESGAGYACYAECLSPVVCLVCRQQNGSAQLFTAHESIGDTRNAKSAAALVFNGEADFGATKKRGSRHRAFVKVNKY